jgi:NRPS condensation-like uncharacterized protein
MNDLQQMMRQWTALAPYNAGHVMRVSGAPDLERWRAAFTAVLKTLELTKPVLIELSTVELDQKIIQELNCPFLPGTLPLRAFVTPDKQDSHLLGVIYNHWFADSPSLRALMQRAFAHYSGNSENLPPLRVAGDNDLEHSGFGLRALISCVGDYLRHRRACRIHLRDPLDFDSGFFSIHFPDGAIDEIRAFAKKHGATVNDVFLATASQALGKFTAEQRKSEPFPRAKRDRVAIATAVDLKPLSARNLDDVFGFFVGYFTVVHDRPEMWPLPELVKATARETSASKNAARAREFIWGLRVARWIWARSSRPRFKAQLFQKGLPFLAGISNVNLTGSWADQEKMPAGGRTTVLDYFRVSPVGPLVPLVFTFTTIRDRLSTCVTYRTTAFSPQQAEQIAEDLMGRLQRPK